MMASSPVPARSCTGASSVVSLSPSSAANFVGWARATTRAFLSPTILAGGAPLAVTARPLAQRLRRRATASTVGFVGHRRPCLHAAEVRSGGVGHPPVDQDHHQRAGEAGERDRDTAREIVRGDRSLSTRSFAYRPRR